MVLKNFRARCVRSKSTRTRAVQTYRHPASLTTHPANGVHAVTSGAGAIGKFSPEKVNFWKWTPWHSLDLSLLFCRRKLKAYSSRRKGEGKDSTHECHRFTPSCHPHLFSSWPDLCPDPPTPFTVANTMVMAGLQGDVRDLQLSGPWTYGCALLVRWCTMHTGLGF